MSESKDLSSQQSLYEKYVNPRWVRLLDVLRMNVHYTSCLGTELSRRMAGVFWISIPATAYTTWDTIIRVWCELLRRNWTAMGLQLCKATCWN